MLYHVGLLYVAKGLVVRVLTYLVLVVGHLEVDFLLVVDDHLAGVLLIAVKLSHLDEEWRALPLVLSSSPELPKLGCLLGKLSADLLLDPFGALNVVRLDEEVVGERDLDFLLQALEG
jgi:hypothetical protein